MIGFWRKLKSQKNTFGYFYNLLWCSWTCIDILKRIYWIVSKGTLYLIPAAASITMSRNQRVNLLFIICRFYRQNKKQNHGPLTRSQVDTSHPSRYMLPGTWHPSTDTWTSPGVEKLASESLHSIPEQNDAQNRTWDCIEGFFIFAIQMSWKTTGLGLLGTFKFVP